MKNNIQLLAIAKKQIGNGGSKYRKYVGASGSWCDMFVFWLYDANGNGSLLPWKGNERTYCPASIKWCQKNLAQLPPYLSMACDPIYFDWDKNGVPNHIGIVEKKRDSGSVYTIEGNTSGGKVDDKIRTGYIQAIFRPHFQPTGTLKKEVLAVDGSFEYKSVYMLQVALSMTPTGIFTKETVMKVQAKCNVSQDGAWGPKTSRAVQKMVGLTGKAIDGQWGAESTKKLQAWINAVCFPSGTVPVQKPAETPKGYSGEFPDLVTHSGQKIAQTAQELAYGKGTAKSTYTYPKGKAKLAFRNAIAKVYPNRKSWSKQCQAGASCDVGAGTVIRYSGYDTNIPRGLSEQIPHLQKSNKWKKTGLSKTSQMSPGDVGIYIGKTKGAHIWIGIGNRLIAEANHTAKYFLHIDTDNYTSSGKKTWGIYRACKATPIRKGDKGTEVAKLQNFLKWYGYKIEADGIDGSATTNAVIEFQKKNGIDPDGIVGNKTIEKMKAAIK